jgi:monofunctional biosynthetic peptidoglycan transglycosylase
LIARIVALLIVVPFALIIVFRFVPPPVTPLMLIRLMQGHPLQYQWVAYDRISPAFAHALIAAEDNRFCDETFGFDIAALRGQVDAWEEGKKPRGASTITMQTAKNLLLWPGRDPIRKAIEAWLTPQLALFWPKRRILEVYLNIVEFGPGIYGAEEAARSFFRKPAADLTPREAAQLVSVLPRPLVWVAAPPGPYVRMRAGVIERRVEQIRPLLGCT